MADAVGADVGLDLELRSAHDVTSWLDEPGTFTATVTVIDGGAATLMDALDAKRHNSCPGKARPVRKGV